ncbi:cell division protein FtsX [Longibacter salinarum]|uniref:Cell division protein FtsX n=1 Tax=Longibacter salinarum TaxID=1850348 RepID=A0A2A8CWY9_9BACT|nr:ABC transporter permease [Longibacter salinarum]PEN13212.1 cell division protein FtsX [Longibacter salinarum]
MLRNYLKIAGRALQRRPGPTLINVFGLTVGLAVCLLIGLWVNQELHYDQFHPDAEQIYRLGLDLKMQDQEMKGPITAAPLGPALVDNVPEVQEATRFRYDSDVGFQVEASDFPNTRVIWADTSFFDVFAGFDVLHGSLDRALHGDEVIVLTASTASRLFGRTDVVGRTADLNGSVQEVTAVIQDPPRTTHMPFDAVGSIEISPRMQDMWVSNNYYTYVKLTEAATATSLQSKLDEMVSTFVAPQVKEFVGISMEEMMGNGARYRYYAMPLLDIHLRSDTAFEFRPNGSITYVYTFSAIALFILLLACINFMNLATARASERATEVGMRKALGAARGQLAAQFLGEAMIMTATATVAALGVALISLPLFNSVAATELRASDVLQPEILLGGLVVIVGVGLIAGSYPAFALSRFQPALVLKTDDRHSSGGHGRRLRQGLVVLQFSVSIALIAGTFIVQNQFDYVQSKRLGLDKEQVAVINRAWSLEEDQPRYIERLRHLPSVVAAAAGSAIFQSDGVSNTLFLPDDAPMSQAQTFNYLSVGFGLDEALNLNVIAGRSFDEGREADSSAVMINEALAARFGWDDPVGHRLREPSPDGTEREWTVIGVVEDFHYQSMRYNVDPLVLRPSRWASRVYVRLAPGDAMPILSDMRLFWADLNPENPFQYSFLDQSYASLHRDTQRTGRLFSIFAGVAILIACLGLFGLATYTAQRRTREIGIRKALGATVPEIVALLSREFMLLVMIAFLVALPVAYVTMNGWLSDFAYRVDIGVGVFVFAGALAMIVALLTVGYHAVKAARVHPAHSLRGE